MKAWVRFLLSGMLLLLMAFPAFASGAEETEETGTVARVTTGKGTLNLREKPDARGRIVARIPNGDCLLVTEEGPEWSACRWQGKNGWCNTAYLTFMREADVDILNYRVLKKGDRGEDVLALKIRLQELGYIRSGSSLTEIYNDTCAERVAMFQASAGMAADGVASLEVQACLFSDRVPRCTTALPRVRSRVKKEDGKTGKTLCGCCMGAGCECCGYLGWVEE